MLSGKEAPVMESRVPIPFVTNGGHESARDRMALILDPESPFLELMPTAGYNIKHSSPNASVLCGIGLVQ